LSIQKVNGELIFKGIAAEVKMENIFYCAESDSIFMSTESEFVSPVNGKKAELIGWVETNDTNKAKEIDKILDLYKSRLKTLPDTQIAKQANAEGGNKVTDVENTEAVEKLRAPEATVTEAAPLVDQAEVVEESTEEAKSHEDTSAEILETAADVSEVEVEEPDFAKMLGDLKGFFSETIEKATESNAAQVSSIKETVEVFSKSVDARISELAEKHTALSTAVESIRSTIDGVEKRVDAVESDTAIKKSSDLGGSQEITIKKSKWNGSFLGSVDEIFN